MGRVYVNFGTIKKSFISSSGFTLIELLLAIAILIILSTIAYSSLDGQDSFVGLERVGSTIEQSVEVAKFNAFNGKKHNERHSPGFGVYFDSTSTNGKNKIITVFANCNSDEEYNTERVNEGSETLCMEEFIEQYELEGDFYVSKLCFVGEIDKGDKCNNTVTEISLIFWSPFAIIGTPELDPGSDNKKYLKIEIGSSNDDLSDSYVLINKYGRSTTSVKQL